MPVFDFVCTDTDKCGQITEKIVKSHTVETISCPECGAEAKKPEFGWAEGSKRHVGVYFNYITGYDG